MTLLIRKLNKEEKKNDIQVISLLLKSIKDKILQQKTINKKSYFNLKYLFDFIKIFYSIHIMIFYWIYETKKDFFPFGSVIYYEWKIICEKYENIMINNKY